jgi:hypothetical protein
VFESVLMERTVPVTPIFGELVFARTGEKKIPLRKSTRERERER